MWALSTVTAVSLAAEANVEFIRGDVNLDGYVSQADVLAVVRSFHTHRLLPCDDAADFDDSGAVDVTDVINLVGFLYFHGGYPQEPYFHRGVDRLEDELGCDSSSLAPRGGMLVGGGGQRVERDEDDGQILDFIDFMVRRVEGSPGSTGIRVPLLISNSLDLDGFTISVSADPAKIWLEGIELAQPFPRGVKPERSIRYTNGITEGSIALSVFMDYSQPFEGNRYPRGFISTVAHLVFGISPFAHAGDRARVYIEDMPRGAEEMRPRPINEFCVEGRSLRPRSLSALDVEIAAEHELFLRGDSNRDRRLNITDIVLILRALFLGEGVLACQDAADVDDSGHIDISDMIRLTLHLFIDGGPLTAPFPNPGKDPTPDQLGNCR